MLRKLPFFRRRLNNKDQSLAGPQQSASRSQSNVSNAPATSISADREASTSTHSPLGVSVVYTPADDHKVDIVFVHGLGGTSRGTWSQSKDPAHFWPVSFLTLDPEFRSARILTFGYNAAFRKTTRVATSTLDFAKDLLFDLKNGRGENDENLKIGAVPLMFVVHSMGGLVVKEAYLQGQHDPEYEPIIKAVTAIIFLATPHRGTNLAQTLNRILQATIIANPKQYLTDLVNNSLTIQKLNEQFRHVAPRLDIVSFYETQPTPIGSKNTTLMIVERDSSVLGYPGEISRGLNANHQKICKFESPNDPNYIAVRNILKSLVSKANRSNTKQPKNRIFEVAKSVLSVSELPTVDYSFFHDQWLQGTCDWILHHEQYLNWRQSLDMTARFLWLNGGPGSGKSVMATFIINAITSGGADCQYFFIRFGDRSKRSLSFILRSIAYQIAHKIPAFLDSITQASEEGTQLSTTEPRVIWELLFRESLFKLHVEHPMTWVLDGLDEADDPKAILRLLSNIPPNFPLRVLLISRKISHIEASFQKIPESINKYEVTIESNQTQSDLLAYVTKELCVPGTPEFKSEVAQRISSGAQANFLWVRLLVDKVNSCHRQSDVEAALQELPEGMEALYDRMALSITQQRSSTDRELSMIFLQHVTCSLRSLSMAELVQSGAEDVSDVLDMRRSIVELCGGLVQVDNGSHVSLIHQTAREYLLSNNSRHICIDQHAASGRLFSSCLSCLMKPGVKAKISRQQIPEFLDYAATCWSSHLASTAPSCRQTFDLLGKFLRGSWILTWIEFLATTGQLQVLIQTSSNLSKYSAKRKAYHGEKGNDAVELELLEGWADDLVKILGNFGGNLRRKPDSIYKMIPPFCPPSSTIYKLFGRPKFKELEVTGLSNETWEDNLARLSFGGATSAESVLAAGSYVAALDPSGNVLLFDNATFEETSRSLISHAERVWKFELSNNGNLLATYGYRRTKIWETSTGECKVVLPNKESLPRPLAMKFVNGNSLLLVGFDDCYIRSVDLTESSPNWRDVANLEELELEGHILNAASQMTISQDGSLVAVAYRGHPLSAWETDGPVHIGHCWRQGDVLARGEVRHATWIPHSSDILGTYTEGVVFKWNPYSGETVEAAVGAHRVAVSRDGRLFVTGDGRGMIRVFTICGFRLLYQLASQDIVFDVTFGPDSHRIYDSRGSYGNVWEPNALVQFAAQDSSVADYESGTGGSTHALSVNYCKTVDSVTAVASSPKGCLYCYGTERGAVHMYHTKHGKLCDIRPPNSLSSIENISFSSDGKYICFSDLSKKLFVKSIASASGHTNLTVSTVTEVSMLCVSGPIEHLLFDPSSTTILVQGFSSLHAVSLSTGQITKSLELDAKYTWIIHPLDQSKIVGFGPKIVQVLDWELRVQWKHRFQGPEIQPDEPGGNVLCLMDRVEATRDGKSVIAQLPRGAPGSRYITLLSFNVASLTAATKSGLEEEPLVLQPAIFNQEVASQVHTILALLSKDNLVFLSKTSSICSWQFPTGPVKELFSLPGNWISRDNLARCSIWPAERSFICPRNGEVGIVRCSALI